MDLQDLLAYQKTNARIHDIERSIASSPKRKKREEIRVNFDEAKKKMLSAEAYADKIVSAYNDAVSALTKVTSECETLIAELGTATDKDAIVAKLEDIKKTVAEISQKVENLKLQSDKAIKTYLEAQDEGKKLKDEYNVVNEAYQKDVAVVKKELEKLKGEVAPLRAKVSADLLADYDALFAQNILNPFVQVQGDDKSYTCGGCFMALSKSNSEQLNKDGKCHCDSCKRIIYKG
ncbi:MAG: hypothetical protein J6C23_06195 [Clostridia bacterium]|nr:hypothetical protein [Clostridia bacterium]